MTARFFFAGVQFTRFRNVGTPTSSTIPTSALTSIPTTGPRYVLVHDLRRRNISQQRGPGGGAGTIDPVSLNVLKGLPLSTNRAVTFLKPDNENFKELLGRVDHSFTQSDRSRSATATISSKEIRFSIPPISLLMQMAQDHKSKLPHSRKPYFQAQPAERFPLQLCAGSCESRAVCRRAQCKDAGIQYSIPSRPQMQFNKFALTASLTLAITRAQVLSETTSAGAIDVSWVKGKHDFRFGGVIERSRVDLNNLFFQPENSASAASTTF